jgi:hypothetical protein
MKNQSALTPDLRTEGVVLPQMLLEETFKVEVVGYLALRAPSK